MQDFSRKSNDCTILAETTPAIGHNLLDESRGQGNDGEGFFETLLDYCGDGKVALLQAYFDESERDGGLLCVAGFAFNAPQAAKLTKEFRAAFGQYGGFHMKDLVHRKKGFKGITDAERIELIKLAVNIVKSRFSYGVAVTVNIHEYRQKAPLWIRGFGDAYPFLCHLAMTRMAMIAREHDDMSRITYVFEAGHACEAEARHTVRQISTVPALREDYSYHGDAFLPKADAVPLQAADLLAWETGKFKAETLDKPMREIRLSLLTLFAANPKRYGVAFCGGASLTKALNHYRALGIEQLNEEKYDKARREDERRIQPLQKHDDEGSQNVETGAKQAVGSGEAV